MDFIERATQVLTPKYVLTGSDMAGYAHDFLGKYEASPICVLRPASTQEVSDLMRLAYETETAIVPVSGNTGLSGGAVARSAAMLSLDRMTRIEEIRPAARNATVEAGVILSTLREAAEEHDLTFPVTFGAQGSARIGGILSTNAGGSNVLRYGNTRAQVLGIEVVLSDGRIMNLMTPLIKDNSGYDLRDLMIGAEGTLGIITRAVVRLVPKPSTFVTAMIAPTSLSAALTLLNKLQAATGGAIEAFEYMPRSYIEQHLAKDISAREPFDLPHEVNVMVEAAGDAVLSEQLLSLLEEALTDELIEDAVLAQSEAQRREMWARREAAAEIAMAVKPVIVNDIALPLDKVGEFLTRADEVLAEVDPKAGTSIVAHLGDGNIHYSVQPTNADPAFCDGIMDAVEALVAELGGTFSAEHGIGLSKRPSMARHKDPVALAVMRSIKQTLDPKGIMNPGKLLPD